MSLNTPSNSSPSWCLIAGDNHGVFSHLVDAARRYKPQFILSVGDLEPQRPLAEELAPIEALGCRVLYSPGNHDSDRAETWAFLESASDRNMHGQIVTVGHLRVAFLGGVFREEIWHPSHSYASDAELFASAQFDSYRLYKQALMRKEREKRRMEDPYVLDRLRRHRTSIFPDVYRRLADQRAHVLISHEAGAWAHAHGFHAIDALARRMGIQAHFFGHHHCRRYREDGQGNISVGVGLRGITAVDGTTILRPGDQDRQRPDPLWS